uniref:Uncharacterized protein n=1 Tax=Panagrolaimus sp. JU765 TaxID=591449 RepID=A0AC34R3F1_9BILA
MLVLTLIFGLIPIKVVKYLADQQRQSLLQRNTNKRWPFVMISLLTSFAGGVFLAIIFLDLLPDAMDAFNYVKEHGNWNIDYPIVELFALIGFFFVYFVEEMSVIAIGNFTHGHDQTILTQNPSIFNVDQLADQPTVNSPGRHSIQSCEIHGHDREIDEIISPSDKHRAFVKSFTFIFALMIHSSLEGFAFGVQATEVSVLSLFFGIIVHKSVVAFSVGMRLIRCHPKNIFFVATMIAIFSITSPIFAFIGTILEDSNWNELTKNEISFILIALSMGTFLYIAFFEMLAPERINEKSSFLVMLVTFLGFALIAVVMKFAG